MRPQLCALALAACSTPAFAQDVRLTPVGVFDYQQGAVDADGAHAIEDAYAQYFTRAAIDKGVISVKPDGDAYVVTWDIGKALAAANAPPDALAFGPFSYRLKSEAGGGWSWSSRAFPHFAFKGETDKGSTKGAFDFDGFNLAGRYDPAAASFLTNTLALDAFRGNIVQSQGDGETAINFVENDLKGETRAVANSAGGVDVAVVQSIGKLSQVGTPPGGEPGGRLDVKADADNAAGGTSIKGLRAQEIGALWRAIVEAINTNQDPQHVADLIKSALPLWNDMGGDAVVKGIRISSDFGDASLDKLGETVKISGLTDEGRIEFGLNIDQLKFDASLGPDWFQQLTPLSANFAVALTDKGVGEAARIALADEQFGKSGDLSQATQTAVEAAIKAGDPRIVVPPGHISMPIIDLAFEGSARIDPAEVSAEMKITADSLDKIVALTQQLGASSPDLQNAVLGLTLVKGLAKTNPDGRLFWDVTIEGDKVLVNGSPLPTGK